MDLHSVSLKPLTNIASVGAVIGGVFTERDPCRARSGGRGSASVHGAAGPSPSAANVYLFSRARQPFLLGFTVTVFTVFAR